MRLTRTKQSLITIAVAFIFSGAKAEVPTPERAVTDPQTLTSPKNPLAQIVPLDHFTGSSNLAGAAWSADSERLFVSTNISGRFNIWSIDAKGSWPVRHTRSDETQAGLTASVDGTSLYFTQDNGGDEYFDVYKLNVNGGLPINVTNSPDRTEFFLLPGPQNGDVALSTKLRTEAQSNLAVMSFAGDVRHLTTEQDPQFGWTPIAWVDDGRALIANRTRADMQMGEIWRISLDGQKKRLLGEPNTMFKAADADASGRRIAASSNSGGQMRAGVYDTKKGNWTWLDSTPWEQTAGVFVKDATEMIVRTNIDARSTLSTFNLRKRREKPISIPAGVSSIRGTPPVSPDGRKLLVYRSGANSPGALLIYDIETDQSDRVTNLAMASLRPETLPTSEVVTFRSFDNTLISAVVTMPANLTRDGSHRAVVFPHGGPTSKTLDTFNQIATALASRGYIVIQPNFRGSTGYGSAFQAANIKDLGGGDLKDVIAAKRFLVESGYVDAGRVGIFGGSYGGFMALMAIGKAPDEFAAAVQLFGIINWRTMYAEQDEALKAYQRGLLGTPETDPDVYDAASPLTYIENAKAPLLSLQGENDIRVPRSQAQEVDEILKAKGNVVETIFYPGEGHGFRKRENNEDVLRRTIAWFEKHL
ncbi:MAG: S9 family peptidase [Pseudomonadota bacterium]